MRKRAIKKCRGINKAKGYGCGEVKEIVYSGLCNDCYKPWLFESEAGKEKLQKSIITGKKKADKEIKKRTER